MIILFETDRMVACISLQPYDHHRRLNKTIVYLQTLNFVLKDACRPDTSADATVQSKIKSFLAAWTFKRTTCYP